MTSQKSQVKSKFKDIISRSTLIHPGPPDRYQLVTKRESLDGEKEEESRLRRWTFGERDPSKVNKTILLVGQTGTGKSTMINNMTNYVMGVEMEDKVWFEIVEEKTGRSQSESQTSAVTVYQICGFEEGRVPFSLTIIDTPGYEDTREANENNEIPNKLLDLFRSKQEMNELDAVAFVVHAGLNRQTNYLNSLVDFFGKDMGNNIVFLVTHSDGMSAANVLQSLQDANLKCGKKDQPVHFQFNNCQNEIITDEIEVAYQFAWKLTKRGTTGFFKFLKDTVPKKLQMNMNVLKAKFQDIISASSMIHPGPPARYKLKPEIETLDGEKEEESRLRRWTLGERDYNKANKTILLVGETGTGKSTMINTLVNYVMGVEMEDKVWFEIVEEGGRSGQCDSRTTEVTVYGIFGFEDRRVPYSLTIVDTPGFGDTKGKTEDENVVEQLHDLLTSDKVCNQIDVVGILVKASANYLDDKQKYIFNEVVSLLGKDLENNIVFLMTHSDGMPATNALQAIGDANIKCGKDENGKLLHFLFNNRQNDVITEATKTAYELAWSITTDGMEGFFRRLYKAEAKNLNKTANVMKDRITLKACIGNLKERIELVDLKQTEIQQTENAFKKHKEEMEKVEALFQEKKGTLEGCNQAMRANQNFEYEVDEPYKERVSIDAWWDTKAVTCLDCEENCHYPGCTWAINPSWCKVMKNDYGDVLRCTSCKGKCTVDKHVKERWRYVTKTRKAKKIYQEKKIKYINNKQNKAEVEKKMKDVEEKKDNTQKGLHEIKCKFSNLEEEMKGLQKEKNRLVLEAYQHIVKLDEIALNTLSVHLDFLIEKMKETGDQEKVQKLEEMKTQV